MLTLRIATACTAVVLLVSGESGAAVADGWVLRADGYGPLRYGMSLAQVRKRTGQLTKVDNTCDYYRPVARPEVDLAFESGRLVSAGDRDDAVIKTNNGISRGVAASVLTQRYPGRVKQVVDNYDSPSQPGSASYVADVDEGGAYTWRFYVEEGKVTHISSGYSRAKDICAD